MHIPKEINDKYKNIYNRVDIKEIYPIIVDQDYRDGFIFRYFAKNILSPSLYILEIDKETYNNLLSKNISYPYEMYEIVKIQWKLVGPYHDTTINNRIEYGVFDTNNRTIQKAKMSMSGIEKKLTDLTQFAKIIKKDVETKQVILKEYKLETFKIEPPKKPSYGGVGYNPNGAPVPFNPEDPVSPPQSVVDTSLLMYLDAANSQSYSGTGTTWYDLTSNGKNAFMYNPAYDTAFGGNFKFNAINQYATHSVSGFPSGSQSGSVEVWAKVSSNVGYKWVTSYGSFASPQLRSLGIKGTAFCWTGGGASYDITGSTIVLNNWYHLVGVYETGTQSLYVNGALVASASTTWNTGTTGGRIGAQMNNAELWTGSIAVVKVYNKALTAAEVSANFESRRATYGI